MAQLAGAVGLEPTPSSLTVRCPTNWTTPQPDQFILTAPRQEPKLRLINSGGFSAPQSSAGPPWLPGYERELQFHNERKPCAKVIHFWISTFRKESVAILVTGWGRLYRQRYCLMRTFTLSTTFTEAADPTR